MRFPIALLLLCLPAAAADEWMRLSTPHFELYTTASEKKGRQAILYFEQVRSFFVQAAPVRHGVTEFPVRIIGFRSEKQYKPYAASNAAAAYYTQSPNRDYIVMQDLEPEHLSGAIHEYMHLIVRHSGLKLPPWLDEGWADVYSTLKPIGKKSMVGDLIPGRVQVLQQQKWLTFDQLTSVDHGSPIYNEKDRAGMFYAESWALAHMLYLAPEYAPKFAAFVLAVHTGKTASEACQIAYGRTPEQVYSDLQGYLHRNRLFGSVFDVNLSKSEEDAEVLPFGAFDSELVLADLLATINKRAEAEAAYRRLEAQAPDTPQIPESLGYLAWRNGDRTDAIANFRKAYDAGSKDPQMCFHLAMLELQAGEPPAKAIPALRRAISLKPDYTEALFELGIAELNAKDYRAAVAAFRQIHDIDAEHASTLLNGLAYAEARTGDFEAARRAAENAKKWDRTDIERQRTENLIRFLDSRAGNEKRIADLKTPAPAQKAAVDADARPAPNETSAPALRRRSTERVEGTAMLVECLEKSARLTIISDGEPLTFDVGALDHLHPLHNADKTLNLTCGAQKPFHIAVEYLPSDNSASKVAGAVVSVEF